MDKNEQRICWYSSVLIVLLINIPKLLALRENGIVARFWHFNLDELVFQVVTNLLFCWSLFYLNLKPGIYFSRHLERKKYFFYSLLNISFLLVNLLVFASFQRWLFADDQLMRIYLLAYFTRFCLSGLLIGILVKIILLLREGKKIELENEQLKSAYMTAELELLKEQMNPHFLFNSLTSLSGVIREDPELAQRYLRELSNVFRYILARTEANLVTVEEELVMLNSFAQLVKMRMEDAFRLTIHVGDPYLRYKIPHLSLQPLLENAVKHNSATILKPLIVEIEINDDYLVISNNLWELPTNDNNNGIGLVNLNERFKIMMKREIEIIKTAEEFIVKLPMQV